MVDDRKRKHSRLDDALKPSTTTYDEGERADASAPASLNRWNGRPHSSRYRELLEKRSRLPVWRYKDDIINLLHSNKVIIIVGDGGTGKTTQVPQFALEAVFPSGMVACTQPWKVGAMSASRRVAEEMDVSLGEEVGYVVPFEACTNQNTILKYLTDVMLLREAAADPILKKYRIVVIDEAHEPSLATDMLFAVLKAATEQRSDLSVVILGAKDTAEENNLKVFFNNAPIVSLSGCLQPVQIRYIPQPDNAYVDLAISTAVQAHTLQPAGDILVFLPREQQVEYVGWRIGQVLKERNDQARPYLIVPLYSAIPLEAQRLVFDAAPVIWKVGALPVRKIFIATKVAETSVVLDGIVYVIDSGFSNQIVDSPDTGVQNLYISRISKTSAQRRAGLAGRAQPGICFRLYTETSFEEELPENTYTETLSLDLPWIILTMKKLGVSDLQSLGYIHPPLSETIRRAMVDLRCLGAVTSEGNLTFLGEMMSGIPLDPQMSAMIIASPNYNCSNEIVTISAMLLVPDCFVWPTDGQRAADIWNAKFYHVDGDHLALLKVYNAYVENNMDPRWCALNFINAQVMNQAYHVRKQLAKIMTGLNLKMCSPDPTSVWYYNNIKLAMLSGYFLQVAHREQPGAYMTLRDNQVLGIDEMSFLNRSPDFVMYTNVHTSVMRPVTDVTAAMLLHVARDYYNLSNMPRCGTKTALENCLLNWLADSEPVYECLFELDGTEIQNAAATLQWETVVAVNQAPEAPATEEQRTYFLPPQ